jgi:hypothetical protein
MGSYYAEYPGCENAAVDVDLTNGYFYAVFDYLDGSDWDLLLFRGDCHDDGSGHPGWFTTSILGGTENTKYPAIGAHDDQVIILAQSDEAGTQDIVCYYSSDAGENFAMSTVAGDAVEDELYPTIVTYGLKATCTFIMNGDLYFTKTTDGGANWDTPTQVNDVNGEVESAFRNVDITTDGTVVWADNRNLNLDIYLDNVGGPAPPGAPDIVGPTTGAAGTEIDYDFSAIGPDGDDVKFYINWGDGETEETGFTASSTPITASHTWAEKGDYTITANAQDSTGMNGPEGTLSVSMPRNRAITNTFFLRFLQQFPNAFPMLRYILGL